MITLVDAEAVVETDERERFFDYPDTGQYAFKGSLRSGLRELPPGIFKGTPLHMLRDIADHGNRAKRTRIYLFHKNLLP